MITLLMYTLLMALTLTLPIVPVEVSTDNNPSDVYFTDGTNINPTNSTNGIN